MLSAIGMVYSPKVFFRPPAAGTSKSGPAPVTPPGPDFIVDINPNRIDAVLARFFSAVIGLISDGVGIGVGDGGGGTFKSSFFGLPPIDPPLYFVHDI